jgi:hypothetical protein
MSFLKKFDWSAKSIAKVLGLVMGGILVFSVVIALFAFSLRTVFQGGSNSESYSGAGDYAKQMSRAEYGLMPPSPAPGSPAGTDAENYEVKSYDATIKSGNIEDACQTIASLKSSKDVIFEYSNQNEKNCSFRFKVAKLAEEKALKVIQSLKPETLNVNVESIQQTVEFYEKQQDILKQQLDSIDETLTKAQNAYDEITTLATKKQDVENLAKIIDNKLTLIDRLATQRLQIKQQIDQNAKTKAEQLDRLKYSFFSVTVLKDKIFDWKQIKDSWKFELKAFVENFNQMLQGISVNLATYLIRFIQVALYFFLSVFLLKLAWIATRRIWKGKGE